MEFNQPIIPGMLSLGITTLKFVPLSKFDKPLQPHCLPASITYLAFGASFKQPLQSDDLPSSLTTLEFAGNRPVKPNTIYAVMPTCYPDGLRTMIFGEYFTLIINPGDLPSSLTTLSFETYIWQYDGFIPSGVTSLKIGSPFSGSLNTLPSGLTSLTLGGMSDHQLEHLPAGIKYLDLGGSFHGPISPGTLPTGLTTLILGDRFSDPLVIGTIPSSVTSLEFGLPFRSPIPHGALPSGLLHLTLPLDEVPLKQFKSIFPTSLLPLHDTLLNSLTFKMMSFTFSILFDGYGDGDHGTCIRLEQVYQVINVIQHWENMVHLSEIATYPVNKNTSIKLNCRQLDDDHILALNSFNRFIIIPINCRHHKTRHV
ncbi:hypothetical protein SAMD00019534_110080 [Acytostelium subglobosum LB1]|uniref:hypothetical protein n=1 Tax=Acytostelium subglobosum LB1 TaxID=1410327 RepID=UPI000644CECD|nr:hypothetical protein SAMD00019534_110080 [Acytostelium subglobosum LB1]GAM27832.1 hypothetical protein SAMD00019534_110080 [Acytostelium subglobosum LB1]|eukprot:XP_012749115.1 hypothetical protein SAMD00019534_110080 [Acytostelium subglobosum LB1]